MSAWAPTFLKVPGAEGRSWIDDHERETAAVCYRIPRIIIAEIENLFVIGIIEANSLSTIIQTSGKDARYPRGSRAPITLRKGGRIFHHEHAFSGGQSSDQTRIPSETKNDSLAEMHADQTYLRGTDVL